MSASNGTPEPIHHWVHGTATVHRLGERATGELEVRFCGCGQLQVASTDGWLQPAALDWDGRLARLELDFDFATELDRVGS